MSHILIRGHLIILDSKYNIYSRFLGLFICHYKTIALEHGSKIRNVFNAGKRTEKTSHAINIIINIRFHILGQGVIFKAKNIFCDFRLISDRQSSYYI